MDWITSPHHWIALLTLTILEIVLGVDNIVFISILAERVKPELRARARKSGLFLAMFTRIALLLFIVEIMRLTGPLFSVGSHAVSGHDLILLGGGLFLLWKSTREIHDKLEGESTTDGEGRPSASFFLVVFQIAALDVVFSLDSVVTAIGMADHLAVMIIAIVLAVGFMIFSVGWVARFIESHPTVKMLALSFLLLIGMSLILEGAGQHVPKGYIYFAMGFSILVEMLNMRARRTEKAPVHLRGPSWEDPGQAGS
jgi:predicted tellurium resistance membrane protein TerC